MASYIARTSRILIHPFALAPLSLLCTSTHLPGEQYIRQYCESYTAVPQDCKRQCDNIFATTGQCRAWAYVNTPALACTLKQPRGSCWLKSSDGIIPIKQKGYPPIEVDAIFHSSSIHKHLKAHIKGAFLLNSQCGV